ncbi:hypothetical protein AURANDRAFT_67941 [Aureococcus anophagefferens]|uniref:Cilia- and flagella-associated protein 36 n=1 Tax=Aureococcus anophagefferens TaxID=44056 RepID=F0YMY7_AURAN|nr:hypothetical protein AURANDRAFT_67941 [Aureococcus anophagefferens]EGB03508.1 hypothetical protein AURANDRAFT_67941 [Aureococcus anophagefferens]|eukprot:XP_009041775.1 hypothetical protein AURANDRAFT_67941 [Aureococcus anophagefferens]
MEDEWMEALHRYVSEGQWSEVSHFVDRNAVLFGGSSTEKEHGEGEYALYVQFRSLVAKVLDSLLEELGCRSEADEARLAIFLRETAESPASGPREEMAKRVLQDLLDIDDFAAFARTMRARNDELETGEAVELERQLSAAADAKARATPETPLGAKHSVFSDSDADLTPFDAVYAGLSDEGFFTAACEPVLECDRGTFLCSGACAEVSKAIAFFADAFETASAVDVREDRVWDVLANGELAVDSKTKKFRPAAEAAARDERCRCGGVPDAHRLVFLARPAKGALCVAALASGDDTKTQQGLAALVNVLTSKEPADRRPYQDSKLTKLLDGGWLDSFVVLCVFVGRETDTADAATRLKHASRLRRLSSAGPAAADAMFESLKSRAMRTKHEEETGRLKREHIRRRTMGTAGASPRRGYLCDRVKVPSALSLCALFLTDVPQLHVARHPGAFRGGGARLDELYRDAARAKPRFEAALKAVVAALPFEVRGDTAFPPFLKRTPRVVEKAVFKGDDFACCGVNDFVRARVVVGPLLRLVAVLDVIGETNQFFVEIGFNSDSFEGGAGSNTYALWRRGWRGLLFDSTFANSSINLHRAFVTPGTVAALLRRHGAPLEPDYVSVDIDSADVWVLRALLSTFRPRVVSVEYNSNFGDGERSSLAFPDAEWMPLGESAGAWRGSCFYGSSAAAVEAVARECGYVVAGVVEGLDLVLVRAALWRWPPIPRHALTARLDTWPAMAREDAAALLDYDVFARGGSLCEARRAAAVALRRMAREPPPRCACFMKDLDCVEWTRNCSCFRDLADLPIPDCAPPVMMVKNGGR